MSDPDAPPEIGSAQPRFVAVDGADGADSNIEREIDPGAKAPARQSLTPPAGVTVVVVPSAQLKGVAAHAIPSTADSGASPAQKPTT